MTEIEHGTSDQISKHYWAWKKDLQGLCVVLLDSKVNIHHRVGPETRQLGSKE